MDQEEKKEKPSAIRKRVKGDIASASVREIDTDALIKRNRELEACLAQANAQLTWATRADVSDRSGGLLTIFRTDDHEGDRAHLLNCHAAMESKSVVLVGIHKPDRIKVICGGDYVAGTGIYKNQQMDAVTSDVNEQIAIAAWKIKKWLPRLAEAAGWSLTEPLKRGSRPRIVVHLHQGNHDFAMGHEVVGYLHLLMQQMCKDWPQVEFYNEGIRSILNLADVGTYNVLVTHGTGHSNISPTGPAFWGDIKDTLIEVVSDLQPHERIRRVLHGHTHWFNVGMERITGYYVDTGGGCQRNERVKLNLNKRPLGWIAYVSPKKYDGILDPIGIQPDPETVRWEMNDPRLHYRNMQDVANTLIEFREFRHNMGELRFGADPISGLGKEGRW